MNIQTTLKVLCFIFLWISALQVLAATNLSPFNRHEDRYQQLLAELLDRGMAAERIFTIFASGKAQRIDKIAINRAYKRATGIARIKTKKQLNDIATQLASHINKNIKIYTLLETRFLVNKEIVAAILFKETHLGQFNNWKHESFVVFNSLLGFLDIPANTRNRQSRRIKRIIKTAQRSLVELLLYCEKNNIDITRTTFPSSFAGAVGIPQFMPMHMNYAVTENNRLGNLNKMSDSILSVGNLLKNRFSWPGLIDFNQFQSIDHLFREYVQFDQKNQNASFCMSTDLDGYPLKQFTATISNSSYIDRYCRKLMNYNFSSNYVLDVLQLASHTHRR